MLVTKQPQKILSAFKEGGVIAYPTEAIYGLGCDPENESAVLRLLEIKQRPIEKGLILVAADFSQVQKYLKPLNSEQLKLTAPSEITYIYPALKSTPKYLTGDFSSLAVRISKHPLVHELCKTLDSAIISTSANLSNQSPAKNYSEVFEKFHGKIDAILEGETGDLRQPTEIRDSITDQLIRSQ